MIPLRSARLCVSCDAIHEQQTCDCGSSQWIHLCRIVQPLHGTEDLLESIEASDRFTTLEKLDRATAAGLEKIDRAIAGGRS